MPALYRLSTSFLAAPESAYKAPVSHICGHGGRIVSSKGYAQRTYWQSSPHQHGSLTGGFDTGPFAIEGEDELEDVADVVDGGMVGLSFDRM